MNIGYHIHLSPLGGFDQDVCDNFLPELPLFFTAVGSMFQLEVGINIQQVVLNLYIITGFKPRDRDTGHKGNFFFGMTEEVTGINKDDLFYNHTLLDYFIFEDMIGHRTQFGLNFLDFFRLEICLALHYHLGDSLTNDLQDFETFRF